MSTARSTSDGIVVDFSHDEVTTIETADDTSATVIALIGAVVALAVPAVGPAAGVIAAGFAVAIALNKAQFASTDKGFGVEVTESWVAITFGLWGLVTMKPLGPGFDQFLLHTGTPLAQADAAANFTFAVGDYNRDGVPDVYCLKHTNAQTNSLEIHILNFART